MMQRLCFHIISLYLLTTIFCVLPMDRPGLFDKILDAIVSTKQEANNIMIVKALDFDHENKLISTDCPIKKNNIHQIGALSLLCEKHKEEQNYIPELRVTKAKLELLDTALSVESKKFKSYFDQLSKDDRQTLIRLSGPYCLDVPEMVRRTIKCCFPQELAKKIKMFRCSAAEMQKTISTYCLYKCLTASDNNGSSEKYDLSHIDWRSTFFQGSYAHNLPPFVAKPLSVGDIFDRTYAAVFLSNGYELHITDDESFSSRTDCVAKNLDKVCNLRILDRKKNNAICCQEVIHKASIKGYCFDQLNEHSACLVTYSDNDLVFSFITIDEDGNVTTESTQSYDTPNNGKIFSVCFDHAHQLCVAAYEGYNSVVRQWDMDGTQRFLKQFSFESFGMMKYMFCAEQYAYNDWQGIDQSRPNSLVIVFAIADRKSAVILYCDESGVLRTEGVTVFKSRQYDYDTKTIFSQNKQILLSWCMQNSRFKPIDKKYSWWQTNKSVDAQYGKECYRTYSPDGRFIMQNMFKNISGCSYVETNVIDTDTCQKIRSIDTPQDKFRCVGFSHDSTKLLFLKPDCWGQKIDSTERALVLSGEWKELFQQFKEVVFSDHITTDLLFKAVQNIVDEKSLSADPQDPTRKKLIELSKLPGMRAFMEKCFPLPRSNQ